MAHKKTAIWLLYISIIAAVMITGILIGPEFYSKQAKGNQGDLADDDAIAVPETIRIVLDGSPNASHAYLFAAQREGYFREQGLLLELVVPKDTDDGIGMVAGGQADVALILQPEVLLARHHGSAVKAIAAIVRRPLTYLAVKQSSAIHYPGQLEGLTVGYAQYSAYEAMVRTMIEDDDADPRQASFRKIGSNFSSVFTGNAVDAVIGANLYHDRLLLEQKGIRVRYIEPSLYGVPSYYETVLVAEEQALADHPEKYEKMWRALEQGYRYVLEHREEAVQMIMERQLPQEQLSEKRVEESLTLLLHAMDAREQAFGYQEHNVWSHVQDWLEDLDVIGSSFDPEDVYDNRLFEP